MTTLADIDGDPATLIGARVIDCMAGADCDYDDVPDTGVVIRIITRTPTSGLLALVVRGDVPHDDGHPYFIIGRPDVFELICQS